MPAVIRYFYAPISGFAYLGEPRLMEIAERAGATVVFRPMDIAAVFQATETVPPFRQSPARLAYRLHDLAREAERAGLPINPKPAHWPVPAELAGRTILAAEATGVEPHLVSFALLKAIYAQERDIADRETVALVLEECGLDAVGILKRAAEDDMGEAFAASTKEAIESGVFGSPTYVLDGEMFFGQDRLDALEWRLGRSLAMTG